MLTARIGVIDGAELTTLLLYISACEECGLSDINGLAKSLELSFQRQQSREVVE